MVIYPLKPGATCWGIETNYDEQKIVRASGSDKVCTKIVIEHPLNLTNAGHALAKIPPYEDESWHSTGQEPARAAARTESL